MSVIAIDQMLVKRYPPSSLCNLRMRHTHQTTIAFNLCLLKLAKTDILLLYVGYLVKGSTMAHTRAHQFVACA